MKNNRYILMKLLPMIFQSDEKKLNTDIVHSK